MFHELRASVLSPLSENIYLSRLLRGKPVQLTPRADAYYAPILFPFCITSSPPNVPPGLAGGQQVEGALVT